MTPKSRSLSLWNLVAIVLLVLAAPGSTLAQPYEANVTTGNPSAAPESSHDCNAPGNPVANCGFESGDFTGWVAQDMADPLYPLSVDVAGVDAGFGFFVSAPTEGSYAALNGFDGGGPDVISLAQDVTLPSGSVGMEFDYRAAWDMVTFGGSTQDRVFYVDVEPSGGGAAMQTTTLLTAQAGTVNLDTGSLSGVVDLSNFAGQAIRISFEWEIPENYTGPAFFQLDNVLVAQGIPTTPSSALVGLGLILLTGALMFLRRRLRSAV